jgi:murein DD-endopeptidase MepM/ murein hydrolase activator NlpD
MRGLTALATLVLLLLPTRVALWLDTVPPPPDQALVFLQGTVGRNESLASALTDHLTAEGVHHLAEVARPVYDLARLSVGRPFAVGLDPNGLLQVFTYGIDDLRTLRVSRNGEDLEAELLARTYDTRKDVIEAEIRSNLFEAVAEAGERDQLALDLADIFAWDVDFNTEIRRGDSFRVAVEKRYLDGRFAGYGRILAATFRQEERSLQAVFYAGASGQGYYDLDGTPLRKAFLRSPLRFTRISSRFTRSRLHPILKTRRPHLGVDYAAPTGTPVTASADGVCILAGWWGGLGRAVRLRHANGYETIYGHLARLHVRKGQRVAQGERIGTVGSTGLATGPHLDYRMKLNGRFVDPLKIQIPPAKPVPDAERDAFVAARDHHVALLGGEPRDESDRLVGATASD